MDQDESWTRSVENPRAKFIKTFPNPQDLSILYFKFSIKMDQNTFELFSSLLIMQTMSFSWKVKLKSSNF